MIRVAIVGASGYAGGELLRILLFHPEAEVIQATSERFAGKFITNAHPNLRKLTQLKFTSIEELGESDITFLCLPHGRAMKQIEKFRRLAPKLIDLSGDFRLQDPGKYERWYGITHPCPEMLEQFVYGIPELNREKIRRASLVTGAGCNATATILALKPLFDAGVVERVVVEVKAGSSEAGNAVNDGSHHPERSGAVRSYKPTGHRHLAEMEQALGRDAPIHFSATSIQMVRGILATAHVFLSDDKVDDKAAWKIYRQAYGEEPFIRIVKERTGIHRYPDPKLLAGTNFCDIGFERDPHASRLVVLSAIDNLMKGAAGQAVQAFNLMHELPESLGLGFPGLHPV